MPTMAAIRILTKIRIYVSRKEIFNKWKWHFCVSYCTDSITSARLGSVSCDVGNSYSRGYQDFPRVFLLPVLVVLVNC